MYTTKKSQKVAGFFQGNSRDHICSATNTPLEKSGEHNAKILQNTTKKSQKSQVLKACEKLAKSLRKACEKLAGARPSFP